MDCSTLKAGDRVWIDKLGRYPRIQTVERFTEKQVVVEGKHYHKATGRAALYPFHYIGGLATPEECLVWDEEKAQKRADDEARAAREVERLERCSELLRVFRNDVSLSSTDTTTGFRYTLEIENLNEAEVRDIAAALATILPADLLATKEGA